MFPKFPKFYPILDAGLLAKRDISIADCAQAFRDAGVMLLPFLLAATAAAHVNGSMRSVKISSNPGQPKRRWVSMQYNAACPVSITGSARNATSSSIQPPLSVPTR